RRAAGLGGILRGRAGLVRAGVDLVGHAVAVAIGRRRAAGLGGVDLARGGDVGARVLRVGDAVVVAVRDGLLHLRRERQHADDAHVRRAEARGEAGARAQADLEVV